MSFVEFENHYLMLAIDETEFKIFFRDYFQRKYDKKLRELKCIEEQFLSKMPEMAQHLLC
jgi:hypothetical protein